jgi:hypothetical protein
MGSKAQMTRDAKFQVKSKKVKTFDIPMKYIVDMAVLQSF